MFIKTDLIKNFRFVILLILFLISVYLIIMTSISVRTGIIISSVKDDSKCKDLKSGDMITQVDGYQITTIEDFEKVVNNIRSGEYVPMVVNGGPGGCVAARDGYIGVIVESRKKGGFEFSIDLQGGYVTQFKLEGKTDLKNLEKTANVFKNRIKTIGTIDTKIELANSTINVISRETGEFSYLTKTCKFVGTIDEKISIKNETANFNLGNKTYKIEILDKDNIKIEERIYSFNQSFSLDNIEFALKNITSDYVEFSGTVLTNKDVSKYQSISGINFDPNLKIYYSNIPLLVSFNASERFVRITEKMDTVFSENEVILVSPFKFFVDGDLITQLNIPRNVAGKDLQTLSLIISGIYRNNVLDKKVIVDLCLDSDQLPVKVEKVNVIKLEPSSKNQIYVLAISSLVVTLVIITAGLYYKTSVKSILFGVFLSGMEITILFGLISASQQFLRYVWLIDVSTLVGVMIIFTTNLIKLFLLRSEKFVIEMGLNKLTVLLKRLINRLEIILTFIGFVVLFTVWKGFGLSVIIGVILWFLFIKPLYSSRLKQV